MFCHMIIDALNYFGSCPELYRSCCCDLDQLDCWAEWKSKKNDCLPYLECRIMMLKRWWFAYFFSTANLLILRVGPSSPPAIENSVGSSTNFRTWGWWWWWWWWQWWWWKWSWCLVIVVTGKMQNKKMKNNTCYSFGWPPVIMTAFDYDNDEDYDEWWWFSCRCYLCCFWRWLLIHFVKRLHDLVPHLSSQVMIGKSLWWWWWEWWWWWWW